MTEEIALILTEGHKAINMGIEEVANTQQKKLGFAPELGTILEETLETIELDKPNNNVAS
ncbi:hypothetical protein PCASD_03727 [Puccinia coronata f. sp. avenae]|uniref:Uncharacterized protein n=1 Tax=Puccinia coronata f. sp. avenae TaxID=200324 RepID=A0A2N5V8C4_9BASI|nr:hypothetical protein PCASD_03727 [Puccinia coronata f. sp. avenae]